MSKTDLERSDSKRHSGRLTRMLSTLSAASVNPQEEVCMYACVGGDEWV